jgi:hypothetical protein
VVIRFWTKLNPKTGAGEILSREFDKREESDMKIDSGFIARFFRREKWMRISKKILTDPKGHPTVVREQCWSIRCPAKELFKAKVMGAALIEERVYFGFGILHKRCIASCSPV